MKNIIGGESRVLCDFCGRDDEQAVIVDQGQVAICDDCITKCFLILMQKIRKPAVKVDENKNATLQDTTTT